MHACARKCVHACACCPILCCTGCCHARGVMWCKFVQCYDMLGYVMLCEIASSLSWHAALCYCSVAWYIVLLTVCYDIVCCVRLQCAVSWYVLSCYAFGQVRRGTLWYVVQATAISYVPTKRAWRHAVCRRRHMRFTRGRTSLYHGISRVLIQTVFCFLFRHPGAGEWLWWPFLHVLRVRLRVFAAHAWDTDGLRQSCSCVGSRDVENSRIAVQTWRQQKQSVADENLCSLRHLNIMSCFVAWLSLAFYSARRTSELWFRACGASEFRGSCRAQESLGFRSLGFRVRVHKFRV